MAQKAPRRIAALLQTSNPATIIFLHGFGDDADGWTDIAQQFHSAKKLQHLTWVFPNAPFDQEAMSTAWYSLSQSGFSPIPVGRSSGPDVSMPDIEEDDEGNEDAEGIWKSVEYLCGLIDEEIKRGTSPDRIVLGGFSQGCAISLATGLASRHGGKIAGIVGLSGYLPLKNSVAARWKSLQVGSRKMKVFVAHGTRDQLVPLRIFRDYVPRVERLVGEVEAHTYEGLGHATSGAEFRDMCEYLERIVPE